MVSHMASVSTQDERGQCLWKSQAGVQHCPQQWRKEVEANFPQRKLQDSLQIAYEGEGGTISPMIGRRSTEL